MKKMYDTNLRAGELRELQEEIRSFIKSLPDVERKPDPMSEEAYFYGLRNFAHFHGARHIDIRLSSSKQEEALRTGKARTSLCAAAWMGFMYIRNKRPCG